MRLVAAPTVTVAGAIDPQHLAPALLEASQHAVVGPRWSEHVRDPVAEDRRGYSLRVRLAPCKRLAHVLGLAEAHIGWHRRNEGIDDRFHKDRAVRAHCPTHYVVDLTRVFDPHPRGPAGFRYLRE